MPGEYKQGYALIVGINEYQKIRRLNKAIIDARDVSRLLIDRHRYPKRQVSLLLDANATKSNLNHALDVLARRVTEDDILTVFFSGHGVQRVGGFEPGEYLCTVETDISDLRGTAISNIELTTALKKIRAGRVVVFLDACHSGGVGEPETAEGLKAGLSGASLEGLANGKGRVILSSCQDGENSYELRGMRNGLFTHYLLDGLRGEASSGTELKILHLCEYVVRGVHARARDANVIQSPWLKASTEDFIMAYLPAISSTPESEKSLSWTDNLHLDFTNRHDEIKTIMATYSPHYYVVHGPAGYGKSELLEKGLKQRFEELKWRCAYVKIQSDAALSQVGEDLATELDVTLPEDYLQRLGQRLGGAICSAEWESCEGVVLLFDLDAQPNIKIAQDLVAQVIPDIHDRLELCGAFPDLDRRFRVIIAGRHLAALPELGFSKIPFRELRCAPFTHAVIQSAVSECLKRTLKPESQPDLAAHLLYLTAGHPGIIAQTLHQCREKFWTASTLLDHEAQIWNSFVYPVVQDIYDEMPPNDAKLRELISRISIFRCLDYEILEHILATAKISGISDPVDVSNRLTATYLFRQHQHLLRDDMTRRLFSIKLRYEDPKKFISLCKEAQNSCLERASKPGEGAQIWVLEYLFQILQQYAGTIGNSKVRGRLRRHFWQRAVPQVLEAYFGREPVRKWSFEHSALIEHLLNPADASYDWEFCFTVNYYLREDKYDEEPVRKLLKQIDEFVSQTTLEE